MRQDAAFGNIRQPCRVRDAEAAKSEDNRATEKRVGRTNRRVDTWSLYQFPKDLAAAAPGPLPFYSLSCGRLDRRLLPKVVKSQKTFRAWYYSLGLTAMESLSRGGKPCTVQKPILICVPAGTLLATTVCVPELVKAPVASAYVVASES